MTSLLLLLAFIANTPTALSDTTPIRIKTYSVSVNKTGPNAYKGFLQGISDTSLQLSKQSIRFGSGSIDRNVTYNEVDNLIVHRPGGAGRGAGLGALGGTILGMLIGAITYTPCNNCFLDFGRGFDMLAGGASGLFLGAIIGIAIGSRKHRFKIARTKQNFDEMRTKLFRVYGNSVNKE